MNKTSSPRKNTDSSLKMIKWCAFLTTAVCLFSPGVPDTLEESVCGIEKGSTNQTTVSINTKKDLSDEWVTTISSYSGGSPNGTNLNVTRRIIGCGGRDIVHVKAVIGGRVEYAFDKADTRKKLLFHPTGGKNVIVSQDRRTVYRINTEETGRYAGILTNRPLNNNELFEVKLDRIVGTYTGNVAIGVTPISPAGAIYPNYMGGIGIMIYDNSVHKFGSSVTSSYKANLYALKTGQRLGVMIKDNGNMHVFVDGVDKGAAASGITYPVYGVIDLYDKAAQATII